MNIKIRQAKPDDWQTIQSLNAEVFTNDKDNDPDMDQNWPFSDFGIKYYQKLANGTYGHCFIAEIDNSVVGYVALAKKTFGYRNSKYLEIENIGVSYKYRSKGIGKELMRKVEDFAREQRYHKLYVQAFWGNTKAVKYYKSNGFTEIGIELEKLLT